MGLRSLHLERPLPELATSIASIYSGTSEIVTANVVGSNITNILLVLGLTAVFGKQIKLNFNIWEIDMPMLLASAFILYLSLMDQNLSIYEATLFLIALTVFLINSVKGSSSDDDTREKVQMMDVGRLLIGGVLVFIGAKYTIYGIENVAALANVSPEFISLTAVALGTSLPEVVVSIAAAKRGKHAIAVGNVLGSNIFNTYAVMSIPRFLGDLEIADAIMQQGLPFMIVSTIIFGAVTISQKISRWEGTLLILIYLFYIGELYRSNFII